MMDSELEKLQNSLIINASSLMKIKGEIIALRNINGINLYSHKESSI
jgi:hypothetical protein